MGAVKAGFFTAVELGTQIGDCSIWVATEGIPQAGEITQEATQSDLAGNATIWGLKAAVVVAAPVVWIYY